MARRGSLNLFKYGAGKTGNGNFPGSSVCIDCGTMGIPQRKAWACSFHVELLWYPLSSVLFVPYYFVSALFMRTEAGNVWPAAVFIAVNPMLAVGERSLYPCFHFVLLPEFFCILPELCRCPFKRIVKGKFSLWAGGVACVVSANAHRSIYNHWHILCQVCILTDNIAEWYGFV